MAGKKLKLMVVDDEQDNLDLLYRTFRREFQVFRADSPNNALEILASEGEMAVIISDQSMPEMTGIEFLSEITKRFPHTVRILLTGYSEDSLTSHSDALNAADIFKCITKPWDPEDFKAVIQHAAKVYEASKEGQDI